MDKLADKKEKNTAFFSFKNLWIWILLVILVSGAVVTVILWPRNRSEIQVPADLDAFMVSTFRDQHYSDHTEGKYPAVAYTVLDMKEQGRTVTVYGVMMYGEYTCTLKNELEVWGSANTPFAITAKQTDAGYELVECWWPKNGAQYVTSIEEKFPKQVREDAVNAQQYYTAHVTACEADALQNIAASDKYTVLKNESDNVTLAYCANNTYAYILFGGGYATDGTYTVSDGMAVFSFDSCKVAFTVDGDHLVYKADASTDVPDEWGTIGETTYFSDGMVLKPESDQPSAPIPPEVTAPVGPAVTVSSNNWLDKTALQELFGQYVPSTFFDSDDPTYFPVRPVETRDQLDRLIEMYGDSWSGMTAEAFAQYDEAFFANNYLLMTYYRDGMASAEPKISKYVYVQEDTSLWLSVRLEVAKPTEGDTVVGQWLLFSGIAKEDYKKANALEAYVEHEVTLDYANPVSDFTLTGKVKEVDGRAMLLECVGNSQFTTVWVELGNAELDPMVGETYTVTYEDLVMPSLPPRITAVTVTKP